MANATREHGFTLLELLATTGVLTLIITLTFLFVHPRDYSRPNRDAERWLGVAQLMQALNRYHADNGKLPDGITQTPKIIANGTGYLDLCADLVPRYLKDLPLDPNESLQLAVDNCVSTTDAPTVYTTGYTIEQSKDGTVKIAAPSAEGGKPISLTHKY
ncbi:MAG TPA: type II secretion system protein [Patescibacteria group bacterium]|nr:type II secretion system protein [Patescibacteria group bacterium]